MTTARSESRIKTSSGEKLDTVTQLVPSTLRRASKITLPSVIGTYQGANLWYLEIKIFDRAEVFYREPFYPHGL